MIRLFQRPSCPYELYRQFQAVRLHFIISDYNLHNYNCKAIVKKESYNHTVKPFAEKLHRSDVCHTFPEFLIFACRDKPITHLSDVCSTELESSFRKWYHSFDFLSKRLEEELPHIDSISNCDIILRQVCAGEVSREVLTIIMILKNELLDTADFSLRGAATHQIRYTEALYPWLEPYLDKYKKVFDKFLEREVK